jgi:hypothetical protein
MRARTGGLTYCWKNGEGFGDPVAALYIAVLALASCHRLIVVYHHYAYLPGQLA